MRIKAAVMFEQGLSAPFTESQPFHFEDVDLEGPGDGEVLVEVRAAGLCHSDLSTVKGLRPRSLPIIGGHEGAGVVVEVGRGVTSLAAGDHVVMTAGAGCGQCKTCLSGRPVLCKQIIKVRVGGFLANGERRFSIGGKPAYHYSGVSSFSQYTVMLPSNLVKIDNSYPLDVAAMFGCAVVTGAGAIFNAANVRPGQTVAVFGLGGVGLNAVMAARISGASQVVGVDINPDKFALARELGCTHTLLASSDDMPAELAELSDGGVDFAIEVSGSKQAMDSAINATRPGGEIVCVGVGAAGARYEYPHTQLVTDEKVIRGSHFGSGRPEYDIPRYLEFFGAGNMPVDRLKSSSIPLSDLNIALDRLNEGGAVRQILLPHGAV